MDEPLCFLFLMFNTTTSRPAVDATIASHPRARKSSAGNVARVGLRFRKQRTTRTRSSASIRSGSLRGCVRMFVEFRERRFLSVVRIVESAVDGRQPVSEPVSSRLRSTPSVVRSDIARDCVRKRVRSPVTPTRSKVSRTRETNGRKGPKGQAPSRAPTSRARLLAHGSRLCARSRVRGEKSARNPDGSASRRAAKMAGANSAIFNYSRRRFAARR